MGQILALFRRRELDYASAPPPTKTIVIIGLSSAGIFVLDRLKKALAGEPDWRIIGIERAGYAYNPIPALRASVVAGWEQVCFAPLDAIFVPGKLAGAKKTPGENGWGRHQVKAWTEVVRLGEREVVVKSTKGDTLEPEREETIPFDICVVATGASYPWPCRSSPAVTLDQGLKSYTELQQAVASSTSVLVIGGGLASVEFAGEVADHYPSTRVTLVSSRTYLTGAEFPERLSDVTEQRLVKLGVKVVRGERVLGIEGVQTGSLGEVKEFKGTKGSVFQADFVFLATGNKPNSGFVGDFSPSSVNEKRQAKVWPTLLLKSETKNTDRIFVVGDVNDVPDVKSVRFAWTQAAHAAANIMALIKGSPLKDYKPRKPVTLFSLSANSGAGYMWGWVPGPRLCAWWFERGVRGWNRNWRRLYNAEPVEVPEIEAKAAHIPAPMPPVAPSKMVESADL